MIVPHINVPVKRYLLGWYICTYVPEMYRCTVAEKDRKTDISN